MESYVLLAKSITYGQRMQLSLQRNGIRSQVYRAPRDISDTGCAYGVEIAPEHLGRGLAILQQAGLSPNHIYQKWQNQYQEVRI